MAVRRSRGALRESRARNTQERAEVTALKKVAFLTSFANCGRITRASESVGIDPDTHYEWRKTDPEYDKAFADLRERVADLLEDEAFRRAHDGVIRPVIGRVARDTDGVVCDKHGRPLMEVEYSDKLLEILLKANRPAKFRERYELSGPDGGPIETHELSDGERAERIAAIVAAARARGAGQATPSEDEVGTAPRTADSGSDNSSV